MVEFKRHLVVFGGFYETNNNFNYFNDIHVFDMVNRQWKTVKPLGDIPPPRSNAQFVALPSKNSILLYGGYSKSKVSKQVEGGITHSDMFLLQIDGVADYDPNTSKTKLSALPWRWTQLRQGGDKPTPPRCGSTAVLLPSPANSSACRVLFYGGVADQEQEDDVQGSFSNDSYIFDVEKKKWVKIEMKMALSEAQEPLPPLRPRMNVQLAVKGHHLFLHGGTCEVKDRQVTLSDFYIMDLLRMDDGWTTLIADTAEKQEWVESSDDDDESLMDVDDAGDDSSSDDDDSEDD